VTSAEFKRWLAKQGCVFESAKGSHLIVRRGEAIKKDLGLK
jgi:hypothetical protein